MSLGWVTRKWTAFFFFFFLASLVSVSFSRMSWTGDNTHKLRHLLVLSTVQAMKEEEDRLSIYGDVMASIKAFECEVFVVARTVQRWYTRVSKRLNRLQCRLLLLASLVIVSISEQSHDKTGGTYEFCHLLDVSAVQARKRTKRRAE